MNPFTTIPKFLYGYKETLRYNRALIPELKKLRESGDLAAEREVIRKGQKRWIENVSKNFHLTFEIVGEENVPDEGPIMVYCNHQSFADIPATLYLFRDHLQMGYIAKEEWSKYKVLRDIVHYTRSIFLKRGSGRDAIKTLSEAKEILGQGFNLLIFPEGTRSQKHEMGEFKAGAFKFAEKAKVPILPVTVDGGYKMFEQKGSFQPCHIKITAHPLVHIENMTKQEQKQAAADIEATIRSAL